MQPFKLYTCELGRSDQGLHGWPRHGAEDMTDVFAAAGAGPGGDHAMIVQRVAGGRLTLEGERGAGAEARIGESSGDSGSAGWCRSL